LSEVRFKEVFWPRSQVPNEAIRDISELQNLYAKVDLSPGVPIQRMHLSREGLLSSLALTPRNRAVSIEVDETAGLEGHALPGTKVDVVLTFQEEGQLISKVIVQNARVLSYGGDTSTAADRSELAGGEMRGRRTSRTITLDVSPKDALQITTARQLGRLSLIMRSADDDTGSPILEIDQADLAQNKQVKRNPNSCKSGRMKMGDREYVVDCDGSISQVMDPNEP